MTHLGPEDFPTLIDWVKDIITQALGSEAKAIDGLWKVDVPKQLDHGDVASNVALMGARVLGRNPQEMCAHLADKVARHPLVTQAWCAGSGFLNLRLNSQVWHLFLKRAVDMGSQYGSLTLGGGQKVHVEFVSANPTGPLHVGHLRGAILGDVMCRLLEKVGYVPWREYYVNDAGAQIDGLVQSVYARWRQALGEEVSEPLAYGGDYLIPLGVKLAEAYRDKTRAPDKEAVRAYVVESMLKIIQDDLAALNIRFDTFSSEKKLVEGGMVEKLINHLRQKGLVYEGCLDVPKGKKVDDWEPRMQMLFRASRFGDDNDRPLQKSDGSWTYFASDIAYHFDKFSRGFTHLINVFGADHAGYLKRLEAACSAIDATIRLDIKVCQLVRLSENGKSVRMSKRSGAFVTLREVVDEVGADAVRFMMLTKRNDIPLDFDFAKVREQSKDNWVFYVQYAHARICSVFRWAQQEGFDTDSATLCGAAFELLTDEKELELMKKISFYPVHVWGAARAHEPHWIVFYLYDLASTFHELWTKGKEATHLRFLIKNNAPVTLARLFLLQAIRSTLASGLNILGIAPKEEMN